MNAELVCVGTELLLGNILNTNAKYLSEKCAELGISLYYQTVVGDNADRLKATVQTALQRSDVVIFTGGLGPTNDDLTKETVSEAMGLSLVYDVQAADMMKERFARFHGKLTENNYKQAYVPEGSYVLYNHNGTAPGVLIEKDGKIAVLLPGPPKELIPMFEEYCEPYFKERLGSRIDSVMVKLIGIGESEAAFRLNDLLEGSSNPTVAPYAKTNQVHLRITARGKDDAETVALIAPVLEEIKQRLGAFIYTTDAEKEIEDVVYALLKEKGYTIATAESLTGGLLAGRLVNVSGASEVFSQGFITYSDRAKEEVLGVSSDTLAAYGAVSAVCAKEMALGAAKRAKADVAIATTGIAGPTGGTDEQPVGTVYVAVCCCGKITVEEFHFGKNRQNVREAACLRALNMVRQILLTKE